MSRAAGHICFHCKQFIPEGDTHDCWTTTEDALLEGASEDLREAFDRLRETAVEFGEQRIYASHHCIMFSRKACHFFVRPKRDYLELCIFLGRPITAPQIKKAMPSSKTKWAHIIQIRHRDQVEKPITDWLREAYALQDTIAGLPKPARAKPVAKKKAAPKRKPTPRKGKALPTKKKSVKRRKRPSKTSRRARSGK